MSKIVKLSKGFDINLAGKAQENVVESVSPETFAIKPTDFVGFEKPKVLVQVGDAVKAGQPLYFDKSLPSVQFCSPVSGEVVAVNRGAKRRLLEIVVKKGTSDDSVQHQTYTSSDIANLNAEDVKAHLAASGVWPNIIQRPYAVVANPAETPKAIFISGFDSAPLAPNYDVIFKGQEEAFKVGTEILKKLTNGSVHLGISAKKEISNTFSGLNGIQVNKFSGPHPAGCVGVQIHNVDPISKGDLVWTVSPYGVIQIGKLYLEGKYDASKIFSLSGSEVTNPQYYKTYNGANIAPFLEGNLNGDNVRVISGNVLSGEKIEKDGFVGFYDSQVAVIPEGDDFIFFGSFAPSMERLSFGRSIGLMSFVNNIINPKKEYVVSTNVQGEHRPFVTTGVFEQVTPMDVLPMQLMKAIMAEDYDEMEALGIYEVAEEDLALCEFVDSSKTEVQSVIRRGLDMMKNS